MFLGFRVRKFGLGPIGERVIVTTANRLQEQSLTASVVVGISNKPLYLDIREGSNSAEDFSTFIQLVVEAGFIQQGDYLVYDNSAVHFGGETWKELEIFFNQRQITTIPMPTYSPELNPIEKCFGMVKHYLRYHRTNRSLLDEILIGFSLISTEDVRKQYVCSANYFL